MMEVPLPAKHYATREQRNLFSRDLLSKISALPGVEAVAMGNGGMPFGGPESAYTIFGYPRDADWRLTVNLVSEGYLEALGIPLNRGRSLKFTDVTNESHVALINEAFARIWKKGDDPIGKAVIVEMFNHLSQGAALMPIASNPDFTVVGVIADTRNTGLRNSTVPAIYIPYTLAAPPTRTMALRTAGDPLRIVNELRRAVQQLDKSLPLGRPITLDEILGFESEQPRFTTALFGGLATLGLILAAIGLYSVISYDVTQRTHEIGIKLALGATRKNVLIGILRKAGTMSMTGIILGVFGSLLLERLVQFQVFAAAQFDIESCAEVCIALFLVAFLASWWPALRAGSVDPVTALRHEA